MICASCTETIEPAETCRNCGSSPLLDGRYRLEAMIGSGGMGQTYRAVRDADGATVAIKELPIRQMDSVKAMEMFEREAAVLEQLDHPGIPDFYENFSAGEGRELAVYLVQERIDGPTLAEFTDRQDWSEEDVLGMMAEILEILAYLHGRDPPVIHRDIKPTNIMRRADSCELVLIDFGSVRSVLEDNREGGSTVAGTFGFMAPEQFMGKAQPSTDIYGLAATAVAVLADTHPRELLDHDRKLHWKPAVDIDPAFAALLDEMLHPSADERPADPQALVERVGRIRSGEVSPETSARGGSIEVEAPPRELPGDFWDRFSTRAGFHMKFGGAFGGLGVVFIVLIVVTAVFGEAKSIQRYACGLSLPGVFAAIGAWMFHKGWRRRRDLVDAYCQGTATRGTITRVDEASYESNDQNPLRVYYQFEVDSGVYTGNIDSFEWTRDDVEIDSEVTVLFDPDDPERNLALEVAK